MLKHARRGFTLAEVIAAVGLVAILSAVIVPVVRNRIQDAYEDALIAEFDNLASAITAYRQDVGKYPPDLDYLTSLRANTDRFDRCQVALTVADTLAYRGPYISRYISNSVGYVVASKDTVLDSLYAMPTANPGLGIQLEGPDTLTAHDIDLKVDGTIDKASGTIQWVNTGSAGKAGTQITFLIPTRKGTC